MFRILELFGFHFATEVLVMLRMKEESKIAISLKLLVCFRYQC